MDTLRKIGPAKATRRPLCGGWLGGCPLTPRMRAPAPGTRATERGRRGQEGLLAVAAFVTGLPLRLWGAPSDSIAVEHADSLCRGSAPRSRLAAAAVDPSHDGLLFFDFFFLSARKPHGELPAHGFKVLFVLVLLNRVAICTILLSRVANPFVS